MSGIVQHEKTDINFTPALMGMLVMVGFVFMLFVFSVYYFKSSTTNELNAKDTQGEPLELKAIQSDSNRQLTSFGWANDAKTKVKVPVETAIQIVIRDYNKR